MADESSPGGATPPEGSDPGPGATPPGQQNPGRQQGGDGTKGATPDTPLGEAGQKALDAERAKRRDAERSAGEYRRRIAELEDAGKPDLERAHAALKRTQDEAEAHATRVAELEAQIVARDLRDMQIKAASEVNLPADMAHRLEGDNLQALRSDAKKLAEGLGERTRGDIGIGRGAAAAGRPQGVSMTDLIRERAGRG